MIVVATLISESVPYEEDRGREKRRDREREDYSHRVIFEIQCADAH